MLSFQSNQNECRYFQVCSSDFVTDAWVTHLSSDNPTALFYPLDVRRSVSSQFQLLTAFCRNSQQAVFDGLVSFATSKLVTPTMLSRSTFDTQVELLVANSRINLLAEQRRTNLLTRVINEQNQLPSGLSTNFLYANFIDGNPLGLFFVQ